MRYASYFTTSGQPTWGIEIDGQLFDLGPSGAAVSDSLHTAIVDGALAEAPTWRAGQGQSLEGTRFLPVLSAPGKIICIGVNYRTHREEAGRADAEKPTVFTRFSDTLAGHDAELPIPPREHDV